MDFPDEPTRDGHKDEAALREAAERFQALSEATSDALVLHDEGLIIEVNEMYTRMYGYSRDELLGKRTIHSVVARVSLGEVNRRIRSGNEGPYEALQTRKDGSTFCGEIRAKAIWYRGRRVRVASVYDITERKRALAELHHAAELLDLGDAFFELDRDWRIIRLNPNQERLSRAPRALSLGREFWDVWPETKRPRSRYWTEFQRCMSERVPVQFEEYYAPLDLWTGITAYPTSTGGIVVFVRDVGDLKRAEQALREADRRKDEFLATLAHELRNPLAPIRNAVMVLNMRGSGDPTLQSMRDIIDRQVGHMARLIDDLLDVSRITRGKLELRREPVTLAAVVEQALETSRPHLAHDLTVTLPTQPIYLNADPVRLAQVFSNLLHNATKYTPKGGCISLEAESRADQIVVRVSDTGIGIPADQLRPIFEIFSQAAPAIDRAEGGLGLGLALARGLVERHGGTIEARSEGPGTGSEFVVRLPVAAILLPPEQAADSARKVGGRLILIVEDNHDAAHSLAVLLRLEGNDVHVAHDGAEALEKAEALRPDVILLDIGLPVMNGHDACRAIRRQHWGADIAIFALTGWGQAEDRRKSEDAGFDGHLVKPVDHGALIQLLAATLAERGRGGAR
jgi:PAS domain S-box-containing protein